MAENKLNAGGGAGNRTRAPSDTEHAELANGIVAEDGVRGTDTCADVVRPVPLDSATGTRVADRLRDRRGPDGVGAQNGAEVGS
jgi:hypothetical protein